MRATVARVCCGLLVYTLIQCCDLIDTIREGSLLVLGRLLRKIRSRTDMRKRRPLIFLWLCSEVLCASLSTRANALCVPLDGAVPTDPHVYVSNFIDALIELQSATDGPANLKRATDPSDAIMVFEIAKQHYECAISYTEPYAESPNENISASAKSFFLAARKLEMISEMVRQDFRNLLDGKTEQPSARAERVGKLQVDGRAAWHFEMNSVVAAIVSLVEFGPDKKQRLILTNNERAQLLAKLRKHFGNPRSDATGLKDLDSSVVVLRDFLSDKARPSHQAN